MDEFGRLKEPVLPDTLEVWLGHPLTQGLEVDEMTLMREWLDDLRGVVGPRRLDGTPRRRTIPPPPRPNPKRKLRRPDQVAR